MREQPAIIQGAIIGPTELFVAVLCKPPQHNEHCMGWRYQQFLADCKLREANVREGVRLMIAERRALREGNLVQLAAE